MKKLIISLLFSITFVVGYGQSLPNFFVTTSGTSTAYNANVTAFGSTYTNKIAFIKFHTTNGGAATINISFNGTPLGAIPIRIHNGSSWVTLSASDLNTDAVYDLKYDASNGYFQAMPNTGGGGSGGTIAPESGTGTATGSVTSDLDGNDWAIDAGGGSINITNLNEFQASSPGGASFSVANVLSWDVGSDAIWDMYVRDNTGNIARIPNGTDGQNLTSHTGAIPTWEDPAASATLFPLTGTGTATGSVIADAATNDIDVINVDGHFDMTGSGGRFRADFGTDEFEIGAANGAIINASGVSITGTSGITLTGSGTANFSVNPHEIILNTGTNGGGSGATGDIWYRNSSGFVHRLGVGSNGDVLTLSSGLPSWSAPAASGITTLNTLTSATQTFATGTSGTDFNISSVTSTHTFNIPSASTTARGLITTGSQSLIGVKTFQNNSIGTTSTDEIVLENATAATSGVTVQRSPRIRWRGHAWKSNATAASQTMDFFFDVLPVTGAASITGNFSLFNSNNGGAETEILRVGNGGLVSIANNADAIGLKFFGNATGIGLASGGNLNLYANDGGIVRARVSSAGNIQVQTGIYIGNVATTPTAKLHIAAGTATASTAPLKFTSGTNLTTTEGGTMEFNGSNLFFTYTDGGTRNTVAMTNTNQTFSGSNLFTGTVGFGNTVSFADPSDGTKILQNDFTGLTTSSTTHVKWATATDNTFVATGLRGSATLDFDLTAITSEDLTITVTGASDGDEVILGVPNAAMVANVSFTSWVSATNTVSVRCKGIVGDNPGSGTFKVLVIKR